MFIHCVPVGVTVGVLLFFLLKKIHVQYKHTEDSGAVTASLWFYMWESETVWNQWLDIDISLKNRRTSPSPLSTVAEGASIQIPPSGSDDNRVTDSLEISDFWCLYFVLIDTHTPETAGSVHLYSALRTAIWQYEINTVRVRCTSTLSHRGEL